MIGIYIHIPFCISKCAYCDFSSIPVRCRTNSDFMKLKAKYIDALKMEISDFSNPDKNYTADTIYIGGGTPSLLVPEEIKTLLDTISAKFKITDNCEITIESNPGSINSKKLKEISDAGVNRLSIGVQSFNDNLLKTLGRIHSSNEAYEFICAAKQSGFKSISIDLIFGIPSQTQKSWLNDLKRASELKPEHISAYILTLEDDTPLGEKILSGKLEMPSDDEIADMMKKTEEYLKKYNYNRYEISNYAKPGFESRHNLKYWNFEEYAGFGSAAFSFLRSWRYGNVKNPQEYISRIKDGETPLLSAERLSEKRRMGEFMMLGLRLTSGIRESAFKDKFNIDIYDVYKENIEKLVINGDLKKEQMPGGDFRIFIPSEKLIFQNEIAESFIF